MPFDLNKDTARLLQAEPFFAALSRRIDKKASDVVPTAGVKVAENGHFEMVYNPEFFEKLSDEHRAGVLKHEFYHLVFEHVTGRLPEEGMTKMWNFATDLAINSNLMNELPEGALIPGQGHFEDMPPGLTAEAYFGLLKKKQQEEGGEGEEGNESGDGEGEGGQGSGEPGEGDGQGGGGGGEPQPWDDHSGWGEANNTAQEIA